MAGNAVSMKVMVFRAVLLIAVVGFFAYRHFYTPSISTFQSLTFGQSFREINAATKCDMMPPSGSPGWGDINRVKIAVCSHYMFNGSPHRAFFEFIDKKFSRVSISIIGSEWEEVIPYIEKKYGKADHQLTEDDVNGLEYDVIGAEELITFGDTGQVSFNLYQNHLGLQQMAIIQSPTRQKDYEKANRHRS